MFSEKKQVINASCNKNAIRERIIYVYGCIYRCVYTYIWRREWQPTPGFLPLEFQGQTMGLQSVRHN